MKLLKNYKILKKNSYKKNEYELLPISGSYIESIRIWRNQQLDNLRQIKKISKFQQIKYFNENIFKDFKSNKPKNILLGFLKNSILVGCGGLVHISWENYRAEVSFVVKTNIEKDKKKKKEYFSVFLDLIKILAFNTLKLKKIYTETYTFREEEIKMLEKNNFRLEATLKDHIYINKKKYDSLIHRFP